MRLKADEMMLKSSYASVKQIKFLKYLMRKNNFKEEYLTKPLHKLTKHEAKILIMEFVKYDNRFKHSYNNNAGYSRPFSNHNVPSSYPNNFKNRRRYTWQKYQNYRNYYIRKNTY